MTIDETINITKSDIKYNESIGCDTSYEEQLVEWLEELKELREKNETLKALYEDARKEGNHLLKHERNKTIDDFVNACKEDILCQTFGLHINGIERIAEQLKAGSGISEIFLTQDEAEQTLDEI